MKYAARGMVAGLLLFLTGNAVAEWTEITQTAVLKALVQADSQAAAEEVSAGESDAATTILEELLAPGSKLSDWQKVCRTYFQSHAFTSNMASFWAKTIHDAGESHERVAQASGVLAAEALAAALQPQPLDPDLLRSILQWLDYLAPGLSDSAKTPIADALRGALAKEPPDMRLLLQAPREESPENSTGDPGSEPSTDGTLSETAGQTPPVKAVPVNSPEMLTAAMQMCLALSQYAKAEDLKSWLRFPPTMQTFYEGTGILLFDSGLLAPSQLESLESLFRAVPATLHNVVAIIVPEGVRMDAAAAALNTTGVVLNIFALPMDAFSNPEEFTPRVGFQAAPEFTLNAAAQLARAVQFAQFAKRPELPYFRDQILQNAGPRPERYLRRFISPGVYLDNPDEFLPVTAYLWFLNSQKALEMAQDLLRLGQKPPMDSLMVIGDLFSAGGPTTRMFSTDEMGRVMSREVTLQRAGLGAGPPFVVGVGLEPLPEPEPWEQPNPDSMVDPGLEKGEMPMEPSIP